MTGRGVFRPSGRSQRARALKYRPCLELVEDRVLLAVFVTAQPFNAVEAQPFNNVVVATFVSNDSSPSLSSFSATITWGDGTGSIGRIAADPNVNGQFIVAGDHTYAEEGLKNFSVLVNDSFDGTSDSDSATATVSDAPLTATAIPVNATEGIAFTAQVATFTDANPSAPLSDFTASIDWGDGTPLDNNTVITQPGGIGAPFFVRGTHTYAEEGTPNFSFSVKITDVGGSTATAVGTANVADAALTATAIPVNATEGIAFTAQVATFTDANPAAPLSDFTASIDWGDGTPLDNNTVITQPVVKGAPFFVTGTHTYAEEGTFNFSVRVIDVGGSTATAVGAANVADAVLTATALPVIAVEGISFGSVVASFTDANPKAPLSDFTASIDWGDGTPLDTNTVFSQPGGLGTPIFVGGTHTYAEEGTFNFSVKIIDEGSSTATAGGTASVGDAALTATGTTLNATEGDLLANVIVATFTDANPTAPLSDFGATISWGDGSSSLGTIVQLAGTGTPFQVRGSHIYDPAGTYPITVRIADVGGSVAFASSVANIAFSFTVTNTNDSGRGSLRRAISNSNVHPGVDFIDFRIPGPGPQVIRLATALPPISDPVTIDGFTQPGARPNTNATDGADNAVVLVAVDGTNAGSGANGFVITAGNTKVDGLAIENFRGWGVVLQQRGGDQIAGNFIGTDTAGSQANGNGFGGVFVSGTSGNTVGGLSAAARNVISANGEPGVGIFGPGATGNLVQGNFIGTDATGTRALGNANIGVLVDEASGNLIGGTTAAARNVISGNAAVGPVAPPTVPPEQTGAGGIVIIGSASTGNVVQGNFLGTDRTGASALGNAYDGISISGAPRNTVGGTTAGAGNVISGNAFVGVRVVGAAATGNIVQGNLIGTDVSGTRSVGNVFDGIFLNNAPGNTIGFTTLAARNIISGNGGDGIQIFGPGATGNLIEGNAIGTDASGTLNLGNLFDGVFINGAPGNMIGATDVGAGNVIARNGFSGVDIFQRGASGNLVQGNSIVDNAAFGVLIQNASRNTIGGTTIGAANMIANNGFGSVAVSVNGVPIAGPGPAGNVVVGNQLSNNGRGPFRLGSAKLAASRSSALSHLPRSSQLFSMLKSRRLIGLLQGYRERTGGRGPRA